MASTLSFTSPTTRAAAPKCSVLPSNSPALQFYPIPNSSSLLFPSLSLSPSPRFRADQPRRHQNVAVSAVKSFSETDPVAVPPETDAITGVFPSSSGVYAVYNGDNEIQFLGLTRNIAASIATHRQSVPELCSSVKFGVVEKPDRITLTAAWKKWMEEHISAAGKVPPGNEPGNKTWIPQAPKKKADLRLTIGRNAKLTVSLEALIDRLVKETKVVAFIKGSRSAPQCGFSQKVVGILDSVGVDYESFDVLDEEYNAGLRETLKKYSNWPTFPQVFVNGELVGGCDILTAMYEKGELADLFKK